MRWLKSPLFPWVTDILGGLCLLSLIVPWMILGRAWLSVSLTTPLMVRILMLPFLARGITRITGRLMPQLGKGKRYLLATGTAVVGIILVVFILSPPSPGKEPAYLLLIIGLFSWVYGVYWGHHPYENYALQRQMVFGAISFSLCFVLASQLQLLGEIRDPALPFVFFWITAIIISTALTRLVDSSSLEENKRDLTRYWPLLLAGLALITLLTAIILAWSAPVFIGVLQPLAQLLLWVFMQILYLTAYVLGYLAHFVFLLLQRLLKQQEGEFQPPEMLDPGPFFPQEEGVVREPVGGDALRWVFLGILAFIALAFTIYQLLKEQQKGDGEGEEEIRESYASLEVLQDWLKLRWLAAKETLQERGRALASRFKGLETAVEVYHELLKKTAQQGVVKAKGQTAHQFQESILETFPSYQKEVHQILQSFSQELYQGKELSFEEMATLRDDIKKIHPQKKES